MSCSNKNTSGEVKVAKKIGGCIYLLILQNTFNKLLNSIFDESPAIKKKKKKETNLCWIVDIQRIKIYI